MLERTLLRPAKLLLRDDPDSHPYPSEEANNYPTLQLIRSNEKYANEGQPRFKNEPTNPEVRHDGLSTYWKKEPFRNSPCRLSSSYSLGLDGKMRSRARGRHGDKKQNEYLAVQSPSSGISIETGADLESSRPDLILCRIGSASHFRPVL